MMLRALLSAIGFARAAPSPVEPTANRGGRPRTYDQSRPASAAERKRRQRWVKRGEARHEIPFRDCHETCHETSPLKEEEKKERLAPPISKDWRPDPDGVRLGKEVFGDEYEAQLADHIDYCLKTDFRCHDHDANWRRRCRYFQRNPQRELDLRPRARQLGVKDGGQAKVPENAGVPPVRLRTAVLKKALSALKSANNQAGKLIAVRAAGVVMGSCKSRWTASTWQFAVDYFFNEAIKEGLDEEEVGTELDEGIRAGEQVAPNSRRLGKTTFVLREFIRPAQKKEASA